MPLPPWWPVPACRLHGREKPPSLPGGALAGSLPSCERRSWRSALVTVTFPHPSGARPRSKIMTDINRALAIAKQPRYRGDRKPATSACGGRTASARRRLEEADNKVPRFAKSRGRLVWLHLLRQPPPRSLAPGCCGIYDASGRQCGPRRVNTYDVGRSVALSNAVVAPAMP
jgi:hypothetical protein